MSHESVRSTRSPRSRSSSEARLERALFERVAATGDPRAREALVERYLPLARSLALRYQRSFESIDDLFQVASVGLVKAVDGFDPDRGIAFSSYAVPTILGEIKRHFRDRTWAVRVPRDLQELSLRVDRSVTELGERRQRQPSVNEVAAELRISEEEVLEAMQAGGAQRTLSFDMPRGSGDDAAALADSIGVCESGFERAEDRATTEALMRMLTERERDILRMRFVEDMTQAEIGEVAGISQMQVSRIIRQAIARMHAVATHRMAEYALD
jgi:RNA polymerase sigma-B factor